MEYRELVKTIPRTMREVLSNKLMDVLLEAKAGDAVPSSVAKTLLYYWQRDQLASEAGLTALLRAVVEADPVRSAAVIGDFGLEEIKLAISLKEE
ncbi:MAG: hypothetical protein JSV18_02865 [Candidatus Bathyarchaeota archaeon]|nr:MAG: hypothetical protein JSV18_02865 [Candidatus Bathyarchaeota archaeon]